MSGQDDKYCLGCRTRKTLRNFTNDKQNRDGKRSKCKACESKGRGPSKVDRKKFPKVSVAHCISVFLPIYEK